MCLTQANREEQEQFVESAVKKQQRNRRKRKPNMFVAAVLECTVRRICSDVCSSYFCVCTSHSSKRRKLDLSEETNETETIGSLDDRLDIAPENQLSILKSSVSSAKLQETLVMPEQPQCSQQCVPSEESQFEEFLHRLTTELTDFPSFEDVDELFKEIDGDSPDLDDWENEIESLLNTSTSDPFHPGLLEALFT